MEPAVERELVLPASPEEVWESLAEPDWLGDGRSRGAAPGGRGARRLAHRLRRVGGRPRAAWPSGGARRARRPPAWRSRLEEVEEGTRVSVIESRPLALLDAVGSDLHLDLGVERPGTPELIAR